MRIILIFLLLFTSSRSLAQVDPSSALLLRQNGTNNSSTEPSYNTGRFIVNPQPKKNEKPTSSETKVESVISKPTLVTEEKAAPLPAVVVESKAEAQATTINPAEDVPPAVESTNFEENNYQKLVELSLSPVLLSVDSSSKYWFYDYNGSGMGLLLGVNIWFSKNWGFNADYLASNAATVKAEHDSSRKIVVDHRMTDITIQYRSGSSALDKNASAVFGLGFTDYQILVPKEETERVGIKSKGLSINLDLRVPKNKSTWVYSWTFLPDIEVSEITTGIKVKGGKSLESYGIKFSIGNEIRVDEFNQIYWRLSHRYDKTIYDGTANQVDPRNGQTPTDVSFDRGISMFEFGYIWGD